MSDELQNWNLGCGFRVAELLLIAERWIMGEFDADPSNTEARWDDPDGQKSKLLVDELTMERGFTANTHETQARDTENANKLAAGLFATMHGLTMGAFFELGIRNNMIEACRTFEELVRDAEDEFTKHTNRTAFAWVEDIHSLYDSDIPVEDRKHTLERLWRAMSFTFANRGPDPKQEVDDAASEIERRTIEILRDARRPMTGDAIGVALGRDGRDGQAGAVWKGMVDRGVLQKNGRKGYTLMNP